MFELANLRVVSAPAEVDNMRYPEGAEFFSVVPGSDCATEREPPIDEVHPQSEPPFRPTGPSRLENLYFANAISVLFRPLK